MSQTPNEADEALGSRFAAWAAQLLDEKSQLQRELSAAREDRAAAFKIGYELTPECQTLEEMTADLCRQIREARTQLAAANARIAELEERLRTFDPEKECQ